VKFLARNKHWRKKQPNKFRAWNKKYRRRRNTPASNMPSLRR